MKRPAFNAQQFSGVTKGGPTNNTAITAIDGKGATQVINISPIAKGQLVHLLLANPPYPASGAEASSPPRDIFQAMSVRVAALGKESALLEVSLGPNIAIHIALPGNVADDIFQQLVDREAMKAPPKTGQH